VEIAEVKSPDLDAQLVAENVAMQLERRVSHRRAMKRALQMAMDNGAYGIKVLVGGRLNGAEIARSESYKEGKIPLHTMRANIDYGTTEANTVAGIIGIKVWICKEAEKTA
jgi:small subunit ribosomal protein S3